MEQILLNNWSNYKNAINAKIFNKIENNSVHKEISKAIEDYVNLVFTMEDHMFLSVLKNGLDSDIRNEPFYKVLLSGSLDSLIVEHNYLDPKSYNVAELYPAIIMSWLYNDPTKLYKYTIPFFNNEVDGNILIYDLFKVIRVSKGNVTRVKDKRTITASNAEYEEIISYIIGGFIVLNNKYNTYNNYKFAAMLSSFNNLGDDIIAFINTLVYNNFNMVNIERILDTISPLLANRSLFISKAYVVRGVDIKYRFDISDNNTFIINMDSVRLHKNMFISCIRKGYLDIETPYSKYYVKENFDNEVKLSLNGVPLDNFNMRNVEIEFKSEYFFITEFQNNIADAPYLSIASKHGIEYFDKVLNLLVKYTGIDVDTLLNSDFILTQANSNSPIMRTVLDTESDDADDIKNVFLHFIKHKVLTLTVADYLLVSLVRQQETFNTDIAAMLKSRYPNITFSIIKIGDIYESIAKLVIENFGSDINTLATSTRSVDAKASYSGNLIKSDYELDYINNKKAYVTLYNDLIKKELKVNRGLTVQDIKSRYPINDVNIEEYHEIPSDMLDIDTRLNTITINEDSNNIYKYVRRFIALSKIANSNINSSQVVYRTNYNLDIMFNQVNVDKLIMLNNRTTTAFEQGLIKSLNNINMEQAKQNKQNKMGKGKANSSKRKGGKKP